MSKDYPVKNIFFFDKSVQILCQQENGPCPLLAIANCLLLVGKISLPPEVFYVTPQYLLNLLGDYLLERVRVHPDQSIQLQQQDQINSTIQLLPKLLDGMDVNVYFSRVDKFEFTEELNAFDAFDISLYHGWLLDAQDTVTADVVKDMAYNELLTKLVHHKAGDVVSTEVKVIEAFLESSASQLTFAGLIALHETMKNNQLSVFFRNNHFSTILKHSDKLYLLVTDFGYAEVNTVVWELLDDIAGNTEYADSFFLLNTHPPPRSPVKEAAKPLLPGTYCRPPEPPVGGAVVPIFSATPEQEVENPLLASRIGEGHENSAAAVEEPSKTAEISAEVKLLDLALDSAIENESDASIEIVEDNDTTAANIEDDDFALALRLQEELDSEHIRQQQIIEARDREAAQSFQRTQMASGTERIPDGGPEQQYSSHIVSQQEEILRRIQSGQDMETSHHHQPNRRDGQGNSNKSGSGCIVS